MNVVLKIGGMGHVPSMKNSKMLARGKLFTKPQYQRWMEQAIRSFESQLRCATQTTGDVTQTEHSPHCLIVWSSQFDDSRQWIAEIHVKTEVVGKVSEGAELTLEQL